MTRIRMQDKSFCLEHKISEIKTWEVAIIEANKVIEEIQRKSNLRILRLRRSVEFCEKQIRDKKPWPDDLITQSSAIRVRTKGGKTRQATGDLINRQRIKAYDVLGRRLVRRSDVESFRANPPGRRKSTT